MSKLYKIKTLDQIRIENFNDIKYDSKDGISFSDGKYINSSMFKLFGTNRLLSENNNVGRSGQRGYYEYYYSRKNHPGKWFIGEDWIEKTTEIDMSFDELINDI
jgi:hypothetical protein